MKNDRRDLDARIRDLEQEIAELKARIPKHSVPPGLLIVLEDLEDDLAALEAQRDRIDP